MRGRIYTTMLVSCLSACTSHKPEPSPANPQADALLATYQEKLTEAKSRQDPLTGWLAKTDCDAMIWNGKVGAILDINIEAAEYSGIPGKFGRRPPPWCWTPEGPEDSSTEWSRDMALAGLMPYVWQRGCKDILERHAAYVKANGWKSGEPTADGRTVYTPSLIGIIYRELEAMGDAHNALADWPDIFTPGLTDFQAHLQMMDIWLSGEMKGTISGSMLARIKEHAENEPDTAFYAYLNGKYAGDQDETYRLLLEPEMHLGSYVRCNDLRSCQLSEWLFVANHLLHDSGRL